MITDMILGIEGSLPGLASFSCTNSLGRLSNRGSSFDFRPSSPFAAPKKQTLPKSQDSVCLRFHSHSTNPIIWDCIFYVFTDKLFANLLMFHLLFLAAQFLSIKIVSQKAEKCNHIPRLFQITSHFSLILFFDMF